MTEIFTSFKLRDLSLPNRIVVSPMCQYCGQGGKPTNWHLVHAVTMALSGAGLMCIEATAVKPEGRITPGDLGLWDDETEAAMGPMLRVVREQTNTKIAIQLAHAGRKGSCREPWSGGAQISLEDGGWQCSAPSALPHNDGEQPPVALSSAGLQQIRDAFADATRRADRLGIDAIEIHGAHGYLLHQFLSPIANQRTDAYGGSLENRLRFPLEIFEVVRATFPTNKPVGFKVSATDWLNSGWDLAQTILLSSELRHRGVDWITASSGGISPRQQIAVQASYQVPFAREIRAKAGVATVAVGLITQARQAEKIIADGHADLVALARGMLYDPRWGWHAAAELGSRIPAPPPYLRAAPYEHKDLFIEPVAIQLAPNE